jgi:hypothetical protein
MGSRIRQAAALPANRGTQSLLVELTGRVAARGRCGKRLAPDLEDWGTAAKALGRLRMGWGEDQSSGPRGQRTAGRSPNTRALTDETRGWTAGEGGPTRASVRPPERRGQGGRAHCLGEPAAATRAAGRAAVASLMGTRETRAALRQARCRVLWAQRPAGDATSASRRPEPRPPALCGAHVGETGREQRDDHVRSGRARHPFRAAV